MNREVLFLNVIDDLIENSLVNWTFVLISLQHLFVKGPEKTNYIWTNVVMFWLLTTEKAWGLFQGSGPRLFGLAIHNR